MSQRQGRDVVHRWPGNPLISVDDLTFQCIDIHNAGIAKIEGAVVLLTTIESLEGRCSIHRAMSPDGLEFEIEAAPFLAPAEDGPFAKYESQGVRDPRITRMDDTFFVTYLAESEHGFRIGLARTDDFVTIERIGLIGEPDLKNGALFPRKIDGRYALLTRPATGSIWITYSDDLEFWGDSTVVMSPRAGYWDANRVGAAGPPIEIDGGWLLLYYGVRETSGGPLFRIGAALLDPDDPSRVVCRCNIPILAPREHYERVGDVGNLVFSCGAILEKDGTFKLYYGGADSCICLGTARIEQILDYCQMR